MREEGRETKGFISRILLFEPWQLCTPENSSDYVTIPITMGIQYGLRFSLPELCPVVFVMP